LNIFDQVRHKIRQTTRAIGNKLPPLQDGDLPVRLVSPDTTGGTHTGSYPTYH